jgi:hypothetical protein
MRDVDEAPLCVISGRVERKQDLGLVLVLVVVSAFVLQATQVLSVVFEGIDHRGKYLVLDQHRVRVGLYEKIYSITLRRANFTLDGDIAS